MNLPSIVKFFRLLFIVNLIRGKAIITFQNKYVANTGCLNINDIFRHSYRVSQYWSYSDTATECPNIHYIQTDLQGVPIWIIFRHSYRVSQYLSYSDTYTGCPNINHNQTQLQGVPISIIFRHSYIGLPILIIFRHSYRAIPLYKVPCKNGNLQI